MKIIKFIALMFAWVMHKIPFFLKSMWAWSIAILAFDIIGLRKKVLMENVSIAFPEKTYRERKAMVRRSLWHTAIGLVEYFDMAFFDESRFHKYFEFEGEDNIKKAVAKNKGAFLLGLHLSNGDFGISGIASQGYPLNLISKEMTLKWLNDLWFWLRARTGVKFIAPRKSHYEILKALKKKEIVIFVLDQFMGPPLGVETVFFGKTTGTAMGLALFSLKTGAPVIPTYTYRKPNGQIGIRFDPEIPLVQKDNKEETLKYMTQVYTTKIEAVIREHPDQWMWLHRRWKTFKH